MLLKPKFILSPAFIFIRVPFVSGVGFCENCKHNLSWRDDNDCRSIKFADGRILAELCDFKLQRWLRGQPYRKWNYIIRS